MARLALTSALTLTLALGLSLALPRLSPAAAQGDPADTAAQSGEGAAPAAPAQSQHRPVLILDQDRMFQESAWGRAAIAAAEREAQALTSENRGIEESLEAEELELTTRRSKMSAEKFAPLANAFDQKVEDFRSGQDGKSRAISRRLDDNRKQFYELAVPVLVDLLADYNASVIIADDAVILSLSAVDVTDQAIELMNARLPAPEADPARDPASDPAP